MAKVKIKKYTEKFAITCEHNCDLSCHRNCEFCVHFIAPKNNKDKTVLTMSTEEAEALKTLLRSAQIDFTANVTLETGQRLTAVISALN